MSKADMVVYGRCLTFFGRFHFNHFFEKIRPGWKVTISTNQGIGIPLLLHAREGVSYLRPSLNSPSVKSDQWSPSLSFFTFSPPFLFPSSLLSLPLSIALPLFPLSLSFSCCLFNFHWKPRTTGIIRTKEILNVIPVESRISGAKSSGHSVHSNAENIKCRESPDASWIFSYERNVIPYFLGISFL